MDNVYLFLFGTMAIILVVFLEAQITIICTSVYLHRHITHHSVQELDGPTEQVMRLILWLMTGINAVYWRAVHLTHHKYADERGDPHSPWLEEPNSFAFKNWKYYRRAGAFPDVMELVKKSGPQGWFDRHATSGPWVGAMIHIIAAGAVILTVTELPLLLGMALGLAVYFIHVRYYTWLNGMINGLGHRAPGQETKPERPGRNIRWLAWLTGGEGLHRNHHEQPGSARFGSWDPGWWVICLLVRMRLAKIRNN